jgi:hypothetical protein
MRQSRRECNESSSRGVERAPKPRTTKMKKTLLVSAAMIGALMASAQANETCRGKLIDISESTFRVGTCEFVREEHPEILKACSKYSKDGRFLANTYCVVHRNQGQRK